MKTLTRILLALVCLTLSCAAAQEPSEPPSPAASAAKSAVQGKVIQDPSGQGIRKVQVSLRGPQQYATVTDESGQFRIDGVQPGAYLVQLERPGYAWNPKTLRDRQIKILVGQDTKDLVFHVLAAGVISGKIVDVDGDPLPNVPVSATSANKFATGRNVAPERGAATNDLGEFRIADLPPGKYLVRATPSENQAAPPVQNPSDGAKDHLVYIPTYFPGTVDQQQASVIQVSPGATATANFGVQMGRVYRVSGTISGLNTPLMDEETAQKTETEGLNALAGRSFGQVFLEGSNGQRKEQNLRNGGKFEFAGVLPGTYHARVLVLSGFFGGQPPSAKLQVIHTPIEVVSSDVTGLQLQLEPTGDVTGKFRVDGDEKIDWKQVSVGLFPVPTPDSSDQELQPLAMLSSGHAQVAEDGSFDIKEVSDGNYQLAVYAAGDQFRDYYTKSVLLGGRDVADTGFTAAPGTVLDVLVSSKGAGIEGTVVDADGKPVLEATVLTIPSSGKLGRPDAYQIDRSDDYGHFLLRGLNPGQFAVLAFDEVPGDHRSPDFARKYATEGEKVQLDESSRKTVVLKLITDQTPDN